MIQISDNFSLKARSYIDYRMSFDTVANMAAYAESSLPDGFITFCEENKKQYQFLRDNSVDPTTGKWREYSAGGGQSDGTIKLTPTGTQDYLGNLINTNTLEVDTTSGELKVINIDGLETTIATLNYVKNLDKDIMDYLNAIGEPVHFKGVVADDAALAAITNPESGDMYIVSSSASHQDLPITSVYDGAQFVTIAIIDFKIRDFTQDPIDLTTEVTGVLPEANIDPAIARGTDYLDKTTYAGTNSGVVKSAETLDGFNHTISELNDTVDNSHTHVNKTLLDSLLDTGSGDKYLLDDGTYAELNIFEEGTTAPTNTNVLWKDTNDGKVKYYTGTEWKEFGGSGAESVITKDEPTTEKVGGLNAGEVVKGLTAVEVLTKILFPYKAPTATITITPATSVYEIGDSISQITFNVNAVKNSNVITSIEITNKVGTKITEFTSGIEQGGNFSYIYSPANPITTNDTWTVTVGDGTKTGTNSKSVEFIRPMYKGTGKDGVTKVLQKKGTFTFDNINTNDDVAIFKYDSSYGLISKIVDINGFDVTGSFTKTTEDIVCLDGQTVTYNVYTSSQATTTKFKYVFSF